VGRRGRQQSDHALHSRVSGRQLPPHSQGQAGSPRSGTAAFFYAGLRLSGSPRILLRIWPRSTHTKLESLSRPSGAELRLLELELCPRFGAPARISDEGEGRGAGPEVLRQVEGAAALRIQLRAWHALHGPVRPPFSLSRSLSLSLSLSLSAGNHWILPYALGFKRLVLLGGSTHGFPFAYSLIPFEIWSLKRFLFVANSVPDGLKISEISFA
jgi:hypothetical protein